jgi:hypothetical protein
MSIDHFLEKNGETLKFTPPGSSRAVYKKLDKKLGEAVAALVSKGTPQNHFAAVTRSLKCSKQSCEYRTISHVRT